MLHFMLHFLVGYIILNQINLYTFIFSKLYFRHKRNGRFHLYGSVISNILKLYIRSIHRLQRMLCYSSFISFRKYAVESIFKKYARTVILLYHFAGGFSFTEAGNRIFSAVLQKNRLSCLIHSRFTDFKSKNRLIFFVFNHGTHKNLPPSNLSKQSGSIIAHTSFLRNHKTLIFTKDSRFFVQNRLSQ